MEEISCLLCGRNEPDPVYKTYDRNWRLPGEFNVVKCSSCGFVYLNPRPSVDEIGSFYPESFSARRRQLATGEDSKELRKADRVTEIRMRPLLQIKSTGRILDVGCSDGLLLNYMKKHGWDAYGVEPHEPSFRMARENFGLNVFHGYIEDADFPKNSFDAITMTHVLEHVHDPAAMVRTIYGLLAPGGVAMFEVPNVASLESKIFCERWVAIDAPRHLFHFTPATLRKLLTRNGFNVRRIIHGSDLGPIKLGYTESLRFFLMDKGIRKASLKPMTVDMWKESEKNIKRRPLIDFAHSAESAFFGAAGFTANTLRMGSRITAIAEKNK